MSDDRLFGLQRHERVMDELRRHGAVRVKELAELLGVSELTIRRDIATLATQNLLTKVHGGATLPTELAPATQVRRRTAAAPRFTIGMVVPSLDYYWPPIVGGARSAAAAQGVAIQLRGSTYDWAEDRRQITRLIESQQVQGLLLAPNLDGEDVGEMIQWIGDLPVPVVLVERQPPRWTPTKSQLEWVRSDHALGVELAVRHLHDQGHRRIGLLLSKGSPTSAHLARGWDLVCGDLGIDADLVIRESVRMNEPGHRETIAHLLNRCRSTGTTALVIHSDPDAMSVAQYCIELGMAIPADLAIVAYDDEVAQLAEPAMTAVRPPKAMVGRTAVELMVARLNEGRRRPIQRVLITPELIIRDSSMPLPVPVRSV
ncbi:DNA-binding LacI/PurR family transcriptional regulator [Kribbella sp. VKM Ac-2527]|uniref:DNA-binding LacI/PurR family transcriptional regulator n=1 Tax=Kribbella caucasensis TaxID=2512215 RepID=A0A4R6KMV7_9ACTN|nr:substrate-binding domain-containing protein [Kribbella sp. VKM Ac-2527]TDO51400.1 DNA-binding LacI/PurR family transcriptional regulator [Kribbella sp. VKM Ac-2527]